MNVTPMMEDVIPLVLILLVVIIVHVILDMNWTMINTLVMVSELLQ